MEGERRINRRNRLKVRAGRRKDRLVKTIGRLKHVQIRNIVAKNVMIKATIWREGGESGVSKRSKVRRGKRKERPGENMGRKHLQIRNVTGKNGEIKERLWNDSGE